MTQNNVKIAVTGGIGSGKSSVCKIIKESGFPVISCDEVYSELIKSSDFLTVLQSEFGNVLKEDGTLDRKKLAEIVFNDSQKRERLNKITHPAIMNEVLSRTNSHKLCFCEVPLLFEDGFESLFDNVIVVLRPKEERVSAVQKRDGCSSESVNLRIKSQINYDKFDFAKYYVIRNEGNLADLREKTSEILNRIIQST